MVPLTAVVYAKDIECVHRFYSEVLGLSVVDFRAGDFVCLGSADDSVELAIVAIPARIAARISVTEPPQRRESTPVKLSFAVEDLGSARRRANDLGGTVDDTAAESTWRGMVHCDGHDPEGNVFQLRSAA